MEECAANAKSACTRDGLCDDKAVESAGARTISKESCSLGELRDTCDSSVFFVQFRGYNLVFGGFYGWKDIWFPLIVTVCANTWI